MSMVGFWAGLRGSWVAEDLRELGVDLRVAVWGVFGRLKLGGTFSLFLQEESASLFLMSLLP
jgi:hypothetical protein